MVDFHTFALPFQYRVLYSSVGSYLELQVLGLKAHASKIGRLIFSSIFSELFLAHVNKGRLTIDRVIL